jgi:hypothetical protein
MRRRLRKVLFWTSSLMMAVVLGGATSAYYYATDSETISDLIRAEAPRFLPGCRVDVIKARIRPFAGVLVLEQLSIREVARGTESGLGPLVARTPRLQVKFDPWAMLKGRFEPSRVTISKPVFRLARRADGSWNVENLLADPLPMSGSGPTPPIEIVDGTVELAEGDGPGSVVLRELALNVPTITPDGPVAFEATAKGGVLFDRLRLEGAFDPATGRVALRNGEMIRLALSEELGNLLPIEAREPFEKAGLAGGEVDVRLESLAFDPAGAPRLRYEATAWLRGGLWKCPKLPFPISDVSIDAEAKDGALEIKRAEGSDGVTKLTMAGRMSLLDPLASPFHLNMTATNLELDHRLRAWTPKPQQEIWGDYFPQVKDASTPSAGRVNVGVVVDRKRPDAEVDVAVDVLCADVSMRYRHFPYPVDHVNGTVQCTGKMMKLSLGALVGNKPLVVKGTAINLGPDAEVRLEFDAGGLPVDEVLFRALPPDVRKVVRGFNPAGSVKGTARLVRLPRLTRSDDPKGRVAFDAWLELNPECSMTWENLKYPVRGLTGKLEIHPESWIFKEMRGRNGQATIAAEGNVRRIRPDCYAVELDLEAHNLPFDRELQGALPKPWQLTWETLNPTGACDMRATIRVDPDRPVPETDRVVIRPCDQTGVRLRFNREPKTTGDPGGAIEMRMDDVSGTFVYDTQAKPPTSMTGVGFTFHGAPVSLETGTVDVEGSGKFRVEVTGLEVSDLRLDERVRQMMPPVMRQFARRLDDRKIPQIHGNLGLGWSGKPGEPAWCRWEQAKVILIDNKVEIGTEMALDHINGDLENVSGRFDGLNLEVQGKLSLDSLRVFEQQVTGLSADLAVRQGWASLEKIEGSVLGGDLQGTVKASLDATPKYSAAVGLDGADLQAYAAELPGHQSFRGKVRGILRISGIGYDPHTIAGDGMVRIDAGDLGTLPVALRFFNVLKLAKDTKTAFDSADVAFTIAGGDATLDPVRFIGNAFSLYGKGKLDVRGDLDVRLRFVAGRDTWHVPYLSDLTRELSGQFLNVRVLGPVAAPTFKPEALSGPGELFKARGEGKAVRRAAFRPPPWTLRDPRPGAEGPDR